MHARPLTGVAYGISSGVLIGTAEAAMAAIARTPIGSVLTTPFPVLFVLAVGLGIGQLQIALQRCRMITLVFIATVVAKTQLVILTALVLDPQREIDGLPLSLIGGMTMFTLAITLVPRHDRLRTRRRGLPLAHTALGMDAWNDQGRGTR